MEVSMKRILAFLLMAAMPLFAQTKLPTTMTLAISPTQLPTTATFTWSYAFSPAYGTGCSATVATNCIQSFLIKQGDTLIATVPATIATSYSYVLTTLPPAGSYTYSLSAVGIYQGGSAISTPVMVSLQVPGQPNAPTSFTVVLQ
jgi:hypothetical protein